MNFDTLAPHFAVQKEQKPVRAPSRTSLTRKIKDLSPEKLGDRQADWSGEMNTLGIYIYDSTRIAWLQEDQKSWGPFDSAFEWSDAGDKAAEEVRLAVTRDDVTFTMAALQ